MIFASDTSQLHAPLAATVGRFVLDGGRRTFFAVDPFG